MTRREGNEFWKGHLEGWRGSGMTQEAYCRQQGLSFTAFARNRNRINRQHKASAGTTTTFVPVAIKLAQQIVEPKLDKPVVHASNAGRIEIRLANGRTIVVMDEVDESQLSRVIRLMETLACC
jgi:hypothetical protein